MRHLIEYLAAQVAFAGSRIVPRRLLLAIGSLAGLIVYALDGAHRRIALENLAGAFPSLEADERRRIARRTFAHFGRVLFDVLKFGTMSPAAIGRSVEIVGAERALAAYDKGRGVLFFTGHFGCWELQALVHGFAVRPVSVIARPLDNPRLNALLERIRTRFGNSVVYKRGALLKMMRLMQAGEGVALLIDQNLQSPEAIFVDYFGRPAATTPVLGSIAIRSGAAVIPVFTVPLPGGRYRLIYDHAIEAPAAGAAEDGAIRELTQRCTDVLEGYVRRDPHLWLWMHRRWKTQPHAATGPGPEAAEPPGSGRETKDARRAGPFGPAGTEPEPAPPRTNGPDAGLGPAEAAQQHTPRREGGMP